MNKTYTALAHREPGWWVATVESLNGIATQARRLDQLEAAVRDLIALWLKVAPDSFEVVLDPQIPRPARTRIERARKLRERAEQAQGQAAVEIRIAARELASNGLTVRDVGTVLGVSHQRAAQLLH